MTIILIPATSVSSVRHQYRYRYRISCRYRTLRKFRYYINTVTGYFSKFDTTLIPVPDISGSAVLLPHRYREYRYRTVHTLLIFSSVVVSTTFQEQIKRLPGEQQAFGESHVFIGNVAVALGSRALNEIVLRFLVSLVLLGRNFEFPKTPRESFLAASD